MATISFQAGKVPLIPALNKSAVMKNDGGFSVQFKNKNDFISYFGDKNLTQGNGSYVFISCPCGRNFEFATQEDFPASDIVCSCGRNLLIYG